MRRRQRSIEIKTREEIRAMRVAGLVVAEGLAAMSAAAIPGASTWDLDQIGREVIASHGATSSFLGYSYPPFPGVICSSRNSVVVHGIPSKTDVLADGDLISIDYGAIVDGWHGDAAVTVAVGDVAAELLGLSQACEKSLWDGIAAASVGGRLTDISHAIESSIRSSGPYGIVENYGGHGIGTAMHMDPHLLNYGRPGRGPRLETGMALAVEPMLTFGAPRTEELDDQWTVVTADRSAAAHWEHTFALLEDGLWVLTAVDGGRSELGQRGIPISSLADQAAV
jgi:methionyl aminopeptidase